MAEIEAATVTGREEHIAENRQPTEEEQAMIELMKGLVAAGEQKAARLRASIAAARRR